MNDDGKAVAFLSVLGTYWIFIAVLLLLWCLLPFAVFGIKGRLDALIKEQKKTNKLLAEMFGKKNGTDS